VPHRPPHHGPAGPQHQGRPVPQGLPCFLRCTRRGALSAALALWHDRLMLQLMVFIIDCPDPMKLAALYPQVTGRPLVEGSGDAMAGISLGDVDLGFQRVGDYRPPRWPDGEHPKQYHLDFEVTEIKPEQRRVVELGATLQKDFIGPDGYGWRVASPASVLPVWRRSWKWKPGKPAASTAFVLTQRARGKKKHS
jgi:hypothetical protein